MMIGTKYSGPCFPRDNKALSYYSKTKKITSIIPDKNDAINRVQTPRLMKILKNILSKNKDNKIGICGLTYKENTNIIKDSQGYDLINLIKKSHFKNNKINIYDNFLDKVEIKKKDKKLNFIKNKSEFIKKSDIIFIMYNLKISLPIIKTGEKKYIIDCWRCIKKIPKNYIKIDLGKYYNYTF